MFSVDSLSPAPAFIAPPFAAMVTGVVHELREFGLHDRRARYRERTDLHFMRPLLVIEDEARIIAATEHELAAGDLRVAEARVRSPGFSRNARRRTVMP